MDTKYWWYTTEINSRVLFQEGPIDFMFNHIMSSTQEFEVYEIIVEKYANFSTSGV